MPIWTSWRWATKYLPSELHTVGDEFRVAIGLLRKARFTDRNRGTPVILGLGLLLRECWRAVEVEPDSQVPDFLRNSRLGVERAQDVVTVIRDLRARFDAGLKDGAQVAEEGQVSSGGLGAMAGVAEVQAAEGEKGQNVDVVEETGTGENVVDEDVGEVEGLAEVKEVGQMVVKEVSGVEGGKETAEGNGGKEQEKRGRKRGSTAKKRDGPSSPDRTTRSARHKQGDSPARNTRSSKRVSKPSKKRRGSDYA